MEMCSLYIHIPFCVKKCAYCDFLSFPSDDKVKEKYVQALMDELKAYAAHKEYTIDTIFIGGGTPTVLSANQLDRIFECIVHYYSLSSECEVTIEMNPKILDDEQLSFFQNSKINRVSIGLQSIYAHHLSNLSRVHTYREFLNTYERLRKVDIQNINIDLMFGLPNQTFEEWDLTLETVAKLEPDHISAYGLIIEEHTPFYGRYQNGELALPDEDLERQMYHHTKKCLEGYGFYQYEISNYSKKGYECRHNMAYWTDKNYIGVGLGAASYLQGNRYKNTDDMKVYLEHASDINKIRILTDLASWDRRLEETFFLGLRLTKGIHLEKVNKRFNNPLQTVYKEAFEKYQAAGCLTIENGFLKLTDKGMDISNMVFTDFLLE